MSSIESWTTVNGKLACIRKWRANGFCPRWDVEYAKARDINFEKANKLQNELKESIDNLPGIFEDDVKIKPIIPARTKAEMDTFYSELSKCKALSLI